MRVERARQIIETERAMNKATAALSVALALAVATPAFAKVHHHWQHFNPAPQSHINSGWGPPANWDEIEVSHPEGGGA
jgi:hypothetical protein